MKEEVYIPVFPPGANSQAILKRMEKSVGKANYTGLYGVVLQKGVGVFLEDVDGNIFLDCLAAASSCSLGYGQQFLTEAYFKTASTLQQSCFTYSPNLPAIQLAEKLIELAPGFFEKKVMIGLSGSDSSGGAIKAMRKYTKNEGVIHFKNDYHGSTGLSQEASDYGNLNSGIYPNDPDFIEFPFPRTGEEAEDVLLKIGYALQQKRAGGIICEAIQGDAGVIVPPPGFIKGLRRITHETGTLLIVDEVQSGMGRTGKWWAFEHEDIVPDIFVTAKGLSSGYAPISAVVGRKDVLDSLDPGQHIFTFGGHPPSAVVAWHVLDFIQKEKIVEHAARIGEYLIKQLKDVQQKFPDIILDVRGKGLMIGVQINISKSKLDGKVFATRCMEKGVYVGFFGVNADVVRIEPPLIIKKNEIEMIYQTISNVAIEMKECKIPAKTYENVRKYSIGI